MKYKQRLVGLTAEQLERLKFEASLIDVSVNHVVRLAVDTYFEFGYSAYPARKKLIGSPNAMPMGAGGAGQSAPSGIGGAGQSAPSDQVPNAPDDRADSQGKS